MEDLPWLLSIRVRGVEIDIIAVVINSLFWDDLVSPCFVYTEKIASKSSRFQWVTNIIAKSMPS